MDFPAPTILVHPMGYGGDYWSAQTGRGAVAVDLPGYGNEPGPFTVTTAVDALASAAASIGGGGPVHVVGVSLGARLAVLLADRRPGLVRSLAVSGLGPDLSPAAAALKVLALRLTPASALARRSSRASKAVTIQTAQAMAGVRTHASLPRIAAPTLVWWGGQDAPTQAASRAAAATVPGARFEEVPHGGHLWTRELPGEFERRFTGWVASLGS